MDGKKQLQSNTIWFAVSMTFSFIAMIFIQMLTDVTQDGKIDFSKLIKTSITSPVFWITSFAISFILVMTMSSAYTNKRDKWLFSDEYAAVLDEYNTKLKFKDKASFNPFIDIVNKDRKHTAYINHIEKKIARYERRLERVTFIGTKLGREKRLNAKILKYKQKILPEYIKERDPWWFYSWVNKSDFNKAYPYGTTNIDRTTSHEGRIMAYEKGKKWITSSFFGIFTASAFITLAIQFKFGPQFWGILFTVILGMTISVVKGFKLGTKLYNSEYRAVYMNRTDILNDYIQYCKNNNIQTNELSYADQLYEAYAKEKKLKEELDASIAELNQLTKK